VLQIFIILKNPLSSAPSEPADLGSNGKHATTRPLRSTNSRINKLILNKLYIGEFCGNRYNCFSFYVDWQTLRPLYIRE
jgi:hypothetical protein